MIAYAYKLIHDGTAATVGCDFTGRFASADDFARAFAALPHPKPVHEIWVWNGEDRDGDPDVIVRRRNRQTVTS
ncbi:hypothetical protein [Actinoplanes missouriensis]|nr:hypothetical protein [Actinoplanes missouriensis]